MKTVISWLFIMMINMPVYADVITDGSLSVPVTLSGEMTIPQQLGTTVGHNLFHSFSHFTINTGESVTFTGDGALKNVISRVTGGQVSVIDGLLQSTVGSANFYLLNPAGVIFGANAQIDVPAAFYLSTSDTLRFVDGSQFSASNPSASVLSITEPAEFGFLNRQGGDIQAQGSTLSFKDGSTVSLSAHNVTLNQSSLTAPSGNIQVQATGDVATHLAINSPNSTPALTGQIALNDASRLDSSADKGGKITLQGGDIVVKDGSLVSSDSLAEGNSEGVLVKATNLSVLNGGQISSDTWGAGHAGGVVITANNVLVDGQGNGASISSSSNNDQLSRAGNAGNVSITSDKLSVLNGGKISSDTWGTGDAGDLHINTNTLLVSGQSNDGKSTAMTSNTNNSLLSNAGNAGNITIQTKSLAVANGGQVSSDTWGAGQAGDVAITATDVLVDGQGKGAWISSNSNNDQLASTGNAGNVSITSDTIRVLGRGQISNDTWGSGRAGDIRIHASDLIIDGQGNDSQFTGIASNTNNNVMSNAGNAGTVSINAPHINVVSGGQISSDTWGFGNAGNVAIIASNVLVDGQGKKAWISSGSNDKQISPAGNAGTVNITSDTLNLLNGGQVSTTTLGTGNAGNINLNNRDTVLYNGKIYSDAYSGSTGNAGEIHIASTNAIIGQNNASISSATWGAGRAGHISVNAPLIVLDNASISAAANAQSQGQTGNINVTASKAIFLSNHGSINMKNTAIIADTAKVMPSAITVSAPDITLKDSEISTAATGNVNAGNININFSNWLSLDPSFITTTATTGNGGDIRIQGGQLIHLQNSGFLTSVSGAHSNGGNINVAADYLVLDSGVIQANAVGGVGGDITLNLKALLASQNNLLLGGHKVSWQPYQSGLNVIQAATENGVSGALNVTAPQFDISASISGLDTAQLALPDIDPTHCESSVISSSSLARAGKGGIPMDEKRYGFIPPAHLSVTTNANNLSTPLSLSGKSYPCARSQP